MHEQSHAAIAHLNRRSNFVAIDEMRWDVEWHDRMRSRAPRIEGSQPRYFARITTVDWQKNLWIDISIALFYLLCSNGTAYKMHSSRPLSIITSVEIQPNPIRNWLFSYLKTSVTFKAIIPL